MRTRLLVIAGTGLVAATYGMVRLAYGLFLPDVQASTGLDAGAAGAVASAASVAYCVGALLGVLGLGARHLVLGAWLTAALGSLGMALAPGVGLLAPAAVLASAGAGLASPGMVGVVERHLDGPARDRAQAVVNSGTGPGLVVAGLMALALLPDWRLGFTVSAAVAALTGVAVLALDRSADDVRTPASTRGRPRRRPALPWRTLARPAVAALLLGAASAAVWTYGRSHLVASGAGEAGSVLARIALGVGGTACVLTARALGAMPAARAWSLTATVVALATGVLALAAGQRVLALVACTVFGWAFVAATSALIAWASELAPAGAGAGTGLLFVLLVAGQAVGAPLVAAVSSAASSAAASVGGLGAGFAVAAAVSLVAVVPALRRPAARPTTDAADPLPARVTCATLRP